MTPRVLVGLSLLCALALSACGGSGRHDTPDGGDGGMPDAGDGGSSECEGSEPRCAAGVHQICDHGTFVDDPCDPGQGCDVESGTCQSCVCSLGTTGTCVDADSIEVCAASCLGYDTTPCAVGSTCVEAQCAPVVCVPGAVVCVDAATPEVCNATGTAYEPATACDTTQTCVDDEGCVALCELARRSPSSIGCSFFALDMDNFYEAQPDAVIVANPSSTLTAYVRLYGSPEGVETQLAGPVAVPPLGQHTFPLPFAAGDVIESVTALRTGGSFRIESDLPVSAYQHSPLAPQATNDASCLLPEGALGLEYYVTSYRDALGNYPSYFDVIATEDGTYVTVTVPRATDGGSGFPALAAGGSMTVMLNRHDTLQVVATNPNGDVTGTHLLASAPIAVFGAVECAQVPGGATYCDHLEEQMVPVANWGTTYVGAKSPPRSASEQHFWRVIAARDETTITTSPAQPGFPITLAAGQWYELATQESFVFTGNEPFAVYQYMSGQNYSGAGTGDPSMTTAVPVGQFLRSYVVVVPNDYSTNYVQIVRTSDDDVLVDGNLVPADAYATVGAYTVANHPVTAGAHHITSTTEFGVLVFGYTSVTSYAYPGGMALRDLSLP